MLCQPKCGSRAYLEQEGLKTSQWFHWKSLRPRIKKRNVLWVKTWHTNNLKTAISLVVLWWLGIAKKPSLSFHAFFCASSFSMQTFPLLMGLSKGLLFSLLPSPTTEMLQRHRAAAAAAETPCGIPTSHRFGKGQEGLYRESRRFGSNSYVIKSVLTLFCYQAMSPRSPLHPLTPHLSLGPGHFFLSHARARTRLAFKLNTQD